MLNSNVFYTHSNAVKNEKAIDFFELTRSLVRNTELANALKKGAFTKGKKALQEDHADIDVMTIDESMARSTLGKDTDEFLKARQEIIDLKEECTKCLPLEQVTSLCLTDRVHITLMAHAIYKNVKLDADIFDVEKGGVDISKAINEFYSKGSIKALKDGLRPVFNKLLGTEGDYFYAIKTKKSDFEEKDLRNFLAYFGGNAKREIKKKKDSVEFGNYNYILKSENRDAQIMAFTTLCAVVLDNADKHVVIKPEAEQVKKSEKVDKKDINK